MKLKININCDLGEGLNIAPQIMPLIDAANIACGGHAGDNDTITNCIQLAQKHKVLIGLHPGYPDRENFGRKSMEMTTLDLWDLLAEQISNFMRIAQELKAEIHHIKLHGALYHDVAESDGLSRIFISVLKNYTKEWVIFCPPGSPLEEIGKHAGYPVWGEGFLDRNYDDEGKLLSRIEPSAMITDSILVWQHATHILNTGKVKTISGLPFPLKVDTFCVHGDNPNALEILTYLREQIDNGKV